MVITGMPDDGWFRQFNEQMQAANYLVDLSGFRAMQQIDKMVSAMRVPFSYVSAAAQEAAFAQAAYSSQLAANVAAASEAAAAIKAIGQGAVQAAAQAAQIFASFPASLFESLRRSQEMWFQAVRASNDFLHLQRVLGTDLAQLLSERAAHYQATLDGRDAFTKAFALCHKQLHFTALRILKNTHDAEDALQDAAEKALIALPTYSTEQLHDLSVEAWFMTIVKRTAFNQKRDGARCASYEPSWLEQRPGGRLEQPEASLLRREMFQAMHEAFRALPELQHRIILLRYFDFGAEITWEELAHYLGCTAVNARVSYKRGLTALRKQLERMHFLATDLAEVIDAFSPSFSHRNVSDWLRNADDD